MYTIYKNVELSVISSVSAVTRRCVDGYHIGWRNPCCVSLRGSEEGSSEGRCCVGKWKGMTQTRSKNNKKEMRGIRRRGKISDWIDNWSRTARFSSCKTNKSNVRGEEEERQRWCRAWHYKKSKVDTKDGEQQSSVWSPFNPRLRRYI